jgi:hypothetical protein
MHPGTVKIGFVALVRDKQALEQIAKHEGEAMAVVLRRLIRQRARELGISYGSEQELKERADADEVDATI